MKKFDAEKIFVSPAKWSFRGGILFSACLKFRNSVILSANKVLHNNFNTFCLILIKLIPHLHNYTVVGLW